MATRSAPSLNGIIPIVAATFTSSGLLDEDSFQALVRHLMGTGAAGLTLFGLVTEFYKLTDAEKARLQSLLLAETARSSAALSVLLATPVALINVAETKQALNRQFKGGLQWHKVICLNSLNRHNAHWPGPAFNASHN